MTSGLVIDSKGDSVKGLSAIKTEEETCHLRLDEASEEDLGSWTCVLGLDERTRKFRWAGTQSLLTEEQVEEFKLFTKLLLGLGEGCPAAWQPGATGL